jgi:hypothetical protein
MLEWQAESGEMRLTRNPEPDAWDQWNQERRQIARALLTYQVPLSGGLYSTPGYAGYYYHYYSSCSGCHYDPAAAGWWTWDSGGLTDPFHALGPFYWYARGFPGCVWLWPRWRGVHSRVTIIPSDPPPPSSTPAPPSATPPPPSSGGAGAPGPGTQPRRDEDARERVPRRGGPLRMELFEPRRLDSDARRRLPLIAAPSGARAAQPAAPVAAPVSPRVPQPRPVPKFRDSGPRAEPRRPEAVRPLARPSSPSPRINVRASSRPASRPATAARSGQVRSSPSRSTPRTSRPPSSPRP